jgi:acetyltransferase (GNAT) family protein
MRFELALREDEPAIRRLLRRTPIPGDITLSLEREPSACAANAVASEHTQILVARAEENGEVVAMGVRGVMDWYVNGTPSKIGYLGQLRVDPSYRARPRLLLRGYAKFKELHEADGCTHIYATTIMTDNVPARRALESPMKGMPSYRHIDDLVTLAITTRSGSPGSLPGVQIADATAGDLGELEQCLARYGSRYQFTPVWSQAVLKDPGRMRDLRVDDFILARRNGQIVGCVALWDQRKFKQTVVRGYSWQLACARPVANVISRLIGSPRLPPVGEQLDMAYVSHVAIDGDDPEVLEILLRRALARATEKGVALVTLGLSRRNVMAEFVAKRFRARRYHSRIYVAFWPDGASIADTIRGMPTHLEVAIL